MKSTKVLCVGAGPAGLTAAYLLSKRNIPVVVAEGDPEYVGGIARTVNYKGYLIDCGGHRFFTKSRDVQALWEELLGDDLIQRKRSSQIFYRKSFFTYPLKPLDAFSKLGVLESSRCMLSYLRAKLFSFRTPRNYEEWVSKQFGKRLYTTFFKTYTEKIWGMPCTEISADWAAQRIKGLTLGRAVYHALVPQKQSKDKSGVIKTLIDSFLYPRKGPGMMWEEAARRVGENGGEILMGHEVTALRHEPEEGVWKATLRTADGGTVEVRSKHVISSMPMRSLMNNLTPAPSEGTLAAANGLKYRDFIVVALILKEKHRLHDNWIYIHDPGVKVGRVQNFKSWSEEMVPDQEMCCYGMEYFCSVGDALWDSPDEELIDLAKKELEILGIAPAEEILDGFVLRQKKAYPVYDGKYAEHVATIREEIDSSYPNLHLVGRNGMHKYNNQDHAMMTSMLTVENILADRRVYDVWRVNQDAEYHEVDRGDGDEWTMTPKRADASERGGAG